MYGYNADGTINSKEASNIRWLFEKYIEYSDNPPESLVEAAREEAELRTGRVVTYDEAKEQVSPSYILEYLTREFNGRLQKQVTPEELNALIEQIKKERK